MINKIKRLLLLIQLRILERKIKKTFNKRLSLKIDMILLRLEGLK